MANAPPVAVLATPSGTLEEYALVTFDAGASYDSDAPNDSVASYSWTFAAVDAPCDPPQSASTDSKATVRFGCAGTYSASVVATDGMSAKSAAATVPVTIAVHTGALLVVAGQDVTTGHLCAGSPLSCAVTGGTVQLTATPAATAPTGLTYSWTVQPPTNRPLDSTRRVTFSPSAKERAPSAKIETDGTAISGDWIFTVEARDAAGVVAVSAMRAVVGNRTPVVTATVAASYAHAFDSALSRFTSDGTIPLAISDPDGDPLTARTLVPRHSSDGGAPFVAKDLGNQVTFGIVVPYANVSDALYLRANTGGPVRSIDFSISDVNGAVVSQTWPIVVGNRLPSIVYSTPAQATHSFDVASSKYRASAAIGTWVDDDGDPAILWGATGDAMCGRASVAAGQITMSCEMAYAGTPAVQQFAGTHNLNVALSDPWNDAVTATAVAMVIGNSGPTVPQKTVSVRVSCATQTTCCRFDSVEQVCVARYVMYGAGSASGTPAVGDADGDPLTVQVAGGTAYSAVKAADLVPVTGTVAAATVCSATPPSTQIAVSVSDGAASGTGNLTFTASCF